MLEVGQVLSLKIRFNNKGDIAKVPHPYIIASVTDDYVEILQIDSLKGKEHKALFASNKVIFYDNPQETVIDKDSYVQLDNRLTIENHCGLLNYRRQQDVLSKEKLESLLEAYAEYHEKYSVDENKIVHITEAELNQINAKQPSKV